MLRREAEMTLQYRIRSKWEDELWRHRIYLCDKLLQDCLDQWCRSNAPFPIRIVVTDVLYLFSPRCYPFSLAQYQLAEQLAGLVASAENEYRMTWPERDEPEGVALIASLTGIVTRAVESWSDRGLGSLSSGEVAEQLAAEIVARQYVVFHHNETTKRDLNHWGI
jgi:hypothetical protein